MLPRAASLVTGRAALGGAAAVGAVAPAQTTSQQISRTAATAPAEQVHTTDDDTWVVANYVPHLIEPEEIDREVGVLINLGSPQALIMHERRAPSICSSGSISDDSGTAESLMLASATRMAAAHEQSLIRNAVHDLLADPTTQAAMFRAMHRSAAVQELLQHADAAALLPSLGFAASHEAFLTAENGGVPKDAPNLASILHHVGQTLQDIGKEVGKIGKEVGFKAMQFFSGLGKQVCDAAKADDKSPEIIHRIRGGLMALATAVFVMVLLRRRVRF